jgi:hypothetical protein
MTKCNACGKEIQGRIISILSFDDEDDMPLYWCGCKSSIEKEDEDKKC